jgi:hypothetical protein
MNGNIVEQAKVAVALDGRDAETVLSELTAKTNEYTDALTKAYQAGDKIGMKNALKDLKDTEKELETFKKQTFDVTNILKNLNGASLKELKKAEQEITAELSKMTRETEKYAEKTKDLQKVTNEISKVKAEMRGLSQGTQDAGFSFKKMLDFGGGMAIFEGIKTGLNAVKGTFLNVVNSTKDGADKFEFAVSGMKNGVDYFWKSIATFDFSNFVGGMMGAIKAGYEYAQMMDLVKEKTWALDMQTADMREKNLQLELDLRNQTLTNDQRIEAGQERIKNEEILTKKKTDIAQNAYDADLILVKQRTKLNQGEIENVLKNFDEEKRIEAEKYIGYEKTLDYYKRLDEWASSTAGMYKGQRPTMTFNEPEELKGIEKYTDKMVVLKDKISKTNPEIKELARQVSSIGLAKENQIDNIVKSYVKLKDSSVEGKESLKRVITSVNSLLAQEDDATVKAAKKAADEQKKYLEQILLQGKDATEKENNEYTDRLKKAGLYGKNKNKLHGDYLKAYEILELQHNSNLQKISEDIKAKQLETAKKWDDEIIKIQSETDQQVLIQLKERYVEELKAAGNNVEQRKVIEEKYRQDVLTAELGQLEVRKQLMTFLGMSVIEIEQQIADKKLEIIQSGQKNEEKEVKEAHRLRKEYNLQSLAEQEADEIAKLEEYYKNKELTTEEYEQALLNIKLNYAKQYIDKYSGLISNLSQTVATFQNADLINLETQKNKELALAGDNADKKKAIEEKYGKDEKAIKKKYADKTFSLQIAQIIADTAKSAIEAFQSMASIPYVGPALGAVAAAAAIAYGMARVKEAKAQRDQVKQLATGQYDVIGEDDGKHYNKVPFDGNSYTKLYTRPTLIAERGPELVLSAPHTRNLQLNYPEILNAIMATRVPQYASGNVPVSNQQAAGINTDQLVMILAANAQAINNLNAKLDNLEAKVVMDQFAKVQTQYDSLKNDVTQS